MDLDPYLQSAASLTLHKKFGQGNCGFGHIYWRKSLMENFLFCAVLVFLKRNFQSLLGHLQTVF